MKVHILSAFSDNYMYLLEAEGTAAAIDPAQPDKVLQYLKDHNLGLKYILNTHHHQDHVSGNLSLKEALGCEIIGPDDGRIPGLDRSVGEGDRIDALAGLQVIETPGHGRSDLSFYLPSQDAGQSGLVFTGDTLFVGGCGRLFECGPADMWSSLKKLSGLPENTLVYCGHEYTEANYRFATATCPEITRFAERYNEVKALRAQGKPTVPSTLAQEQHTNIFLQAEARDVQEALHRVGAEPAEVFAELRHQKDIF